MTGPRRVGDWIADRYEVFQVLQGGMSLVYVAHDHLAAAGRRLVAVKTLREELLDDASRRARFATECGLWVRLGEHPHIVRAHDLAECDGRPYVVLELIRGGDLRRWIGTPRLTLPRALRFATEICLGLEHAQRQGLQCHRDLKPANLMIADDGRLKITDFGLVRIRDELLGVESLDPRAPIPLDDLDEPAEIVWTDPRDRLDAPPLRPRRPGRLRPEPPDERPAVEPPPTEPDPFADDSTTVIGTEPLTMGTTIDWRPPRGESPGLDPMRLTATGLMLGTVPYMAPEQFEDAKSADIRADLYAIGIILFEMIAGCRPFQGNTVGKLRRQHTRSTPPSIAPHVPKRAAREAPRLEAILGRCLAKDPDARFASASELRRALALVLRRVE